VLGALGVLMGEVSAHAATNASSISIAKILVVILFFIFS
jgi:hypothetical protein